MHFFTRKWIKPEDLNPNGSLFGGTILKWIDEEAAIYTVCQLDTKAIVTKYISEINFQSSAKKGEIIEMGMEVVSFGRTSITLKCIVRNKISKRHIVTVDKIVFVKVDESGSPVPHGKTVAKTIEEE